MRFFYKAGSTVMTVRCRCGYECEDAEVAARNIAASTRAVEAYSGWDARCICGIYPVDYRMSLEILSLLDNA